MLTRRSAPFSDKIKNQSTKRINRTQGFLRAMGRALQGGDAAYTFIMQNRQLAVPAMPVMITFQITFVEFPVHCTDRVENKAANETDNRQ